MTKEQLIELLNKYKEQSDLKEFISKIYLHKDVLPVIEFTLGNRTFAFDVKSVSTENDFKQRRRKNFKQFADFISFSGAVSEND